MIRSRRRSFPALAVAAGAIVAAFFPPRARAQSTFDPRFDVCTFYTNQSGSANHFVQSQFDIMRWTSPNGHMIQMGSDAHRADLASTGNVLGSYYNTLTNEYTASGHDPTAGADLIEGYFQSNQTSTGLEPTWISLNEISSSLWVNSPDYRSWLEGVVDRLHSVYGHQVLLFSPFPNAANNAADWRTLASDCYITIEKYIDGQTVKNNGYSVTWLQQQYVAARQHYLNFGIDPSRIFIAEDYAGTTAGTAYGRSGLSIADWQQAITARDDALRNGGFAGVVGYGWSNNPGLYPESDQIAAEEAYRSHIVVESEGPKWHGGSGLWSNSGNWASPFAPVPPDGVSTVANFTTAQTAPTTITLDSSRTIGRITFDSPAPYTIVQGTDPTAALTFTNNGLPATMTVPAGSGAHIIAAPVTLFDPTEFHITGTALTLSGALSNPGGQLLTKSGAGSLILSGPQAQAAGSRLLITGGNVTLASDAANLNVTAAAGSLTIAATNHLGSLSLGAGATAALAPNTGRTVLVTPSLSLTAGAVLDLTDNAAILDYTGASPLAQIKSLLATAAGPRLRWDGPAGITSSTAGQVAMHQILSPATGVGYSESSLYLSRTGSGTFDNQSIDNSAVLIRYTFAGDANLDGKVDDADVNILVAHYLQDPGNNLWTDGDFTYDGKVDNRDLDLLSATYGQSDPGIQISAAGYAKLESLTAAVPEPSGLVILAVCGLALVRPCSRHRGKPQHHIAC